MDYQDKYIKYKTKYLELKKNTNNQIGGSKNNYNMNHINETIENMKNDGYKINFIIAHILKKIMNEFEIKNNEYMIIAGYCLHKYRDVGDLDVIIEEGKPYNKLRDSGLFKIDIAKISNDERLVLKLYNIDNEAEIEIFPKSRKIGFPSNYYSLENLQSKKLLKLDDHGNPYYNEKTCIKQYSDIKLNNEGEYYSGNFKISEQRVEKNLLQLETILSNIVNEKTKKYCEKKILLLKNILSKKNRYIEIITK